MALSPQLLQLKSSGVYRLEFDKSQTANINVATLRLVVGHSKKGPYNTPVLIENVEAFIQVYGNVDKSLEKKGMFFHRSALTALSRGPILALNLAHFGESDLASYAQISTNGSYTNFTPSSRLSGETWNVGDEKTEAVLATQIQIDEELANAGTWTDVDGDPVIALTQTMTAAVYYTQAEYDADQVSSSYDMLPHSTGTKPYASFFDTDKFMIPSDKKVLNALDDLNDGEQVLNFVNIKQDPITVITRKAQDTDGFDITAREWYGEGNVPEYLDDKDLVSDYMIDVFVFKGKFDASQMDTDPVYGAYFNSNGLLKNKLESFANLRQVEMLASYTGSMLPGFKDLEGRNLYIETSINAEARRTGLFCAINEEDVIRETGTTLDIVGHSFDEGSDHIALSYNVANRSVALALNAGITYTANGTSALFTYDSANDPNFDANDTDTMYQLNIKKGHYLRNGSRLALVSQVTKGKTIGSVTTWTVKLTENAPAVLPTEYIQSLEEASTAYTTFVFNGASITPETIGSCLQAISLGTGLATGLVDKDAIEFRYIVDTFGSFDEGVIRNKIELSQLAKERQNAAAILNAPMVSDFKASTDPSFTDSNNTFKTTFLKDGGNLDKNPTSLYTLPSIADGANFAFYYGPGLLVRENGKDVMVPPAAYVSNNYIDKYTDALPWSIVAGPRRGVVAGTNVAGAEYSFDKADRDILEPFGYNPIVFQRGVGLTILGNKTAQQSIKSALSSAHVREVLIYIQDAMADILKDYVFEFNTAQTRLEIKTLADSLLESVRQDGGVYDFKNIMDQSNNTGEVIDNNIGIIDTFVEPVKGLEIIVHRTTILNTGEIQTGNFS